MGIMGMIRDRKDRIVNAFDRQADARTLRQADELELLRKKNEKLQIREDIKSSLKAEKQRRSDLKYSGVKSFLGNARQELKKIQTNKQNTGVLFTGGKLKKKKAENRFSNEGVFYNK